MLKDQQMHFGFMDIILLHSSLQHVLATHVAIFRVENKKKSINKMCINHSTVEKSCSFW